MACFYGAFSLNARYTHTPPQQRMWHNMLIIIVTAGIPRVPPSPPSSPQTPTCRRHSSGRHNASTGHTLRRDPELSKFSAWPRSPRRAPGGWRIPQAWKACAPPRGRMCDMLRERHDDAKHRGHDAFTFWEYPVSVDFGLPLHSKKGRASSAPAHDALSHFLWARLLLYLRRREDAARSR